MGIVELAARGLTLPNGKRIDLTPEQTVRAVLRLIREPTHAMERAALESIAVDDEGPFPSMLDILDFSGENKAHTVIRAALMAAIDAALTDA